MVGKTRGSAVLIARRAAVGGLLLALAGCAQPGTAPGTAAPAPQGPATSAAAGVPMRIPQIRWPVFGAAANSGAAGGTATPLVTDPFAGQGVLQPGVPPAAGARTTATAQTSQSSAATTHTVAAGETAWSIARRYGVSVGDLAAANQLPETMSVRLGQRLTIPAHSAAGTSAAAVVTAPGTGSPTPPPPSAARPLPAEKTEPASKQAPKADSPDLGKTRTAASGSGKFAMPANGAIARAYKKGTNEGIDISAAPGSPVVAAGGGTVAAVTRDTDGVPIVVVRHDDGLMTVYAGIDGLSVGKGDSVTRGQSIGTARSSGIVHFEVRQGFDSVDPEDYL